MKGIILAGGTGSRLLPLTKVTNKHLLPVYNKPMIYYPIEFLRDCGIHDIMIILGGNSTGDFIQLLGDGAQFGVNITYRFQYKADGIASALKLAKNFINYEPFVVHLGDNVFLDHIGPLTALLNSIMNLDYPFAQVFLAPTDKPSSFGVPTIQDNKIVQITEKPKHPDSNFAVTGLYIYDRFIWSMIDSLHPSKRGELEITDVNNWYIQNGILGFGYVSGHWHDCGDIEALAKTSELIRNRVNNGS